MISPLPLEELRALLALRFTPGLGALRIRALMRHFGNAEAVFGAKLSSLREVDGLEAKSVAAIGKLEWLERANTELERVHKVGARLIGYGAPDYPQALHALPDPPAVLWVRGELPELETVPKAIGIVGTRKASPQGLAFSRKLARALSEVGIKIISGLARGIDTAAHEACLEGGSLTIGVLGSGVDVIYPSENVRLASRMTVLSEHPLGTPPASFNFPGRNRLIAALSAGSVIVEGDVKSGAMITAGAALECGRTVFAVPGRPLEVLSQGPHKLLREGATLCESAEDIVLEFGWLSKPALPLPDLPPEQLKVLGALEGTPLLDDIALRCGLSSFEVQSVLMMLRFQGLVQELPGGRYSRG